LSLLVETDFTIVGDLSLDFKSFLSCDLTSFLLVGGLAFLGGELIGFVSTAPSDFFTAIYYKMVLLLNRSRALIGLVIFSASLSEYY